MTNCYGLKIQCSQQVPLLRLDDQQVALLKGDCLRKALISSGVNHCVHIWML